FMPESLEYRPLFNGNISSMAVYNRALTTPAHAGSPLMFYNYHYDQLNRLTQMDSYKKFNLTTNTWAGLSRQVNSYKERIVYDPNGNILQYRRDGHKEAYIMDSLTYTYNSNTNKLNW